MSTPLTVIPFYYRCVGPKEDEFILRIFKGLYYTLMADKSLEALWLDKAHWHLFYSIYYCKEDPRTVIPKINPWGKPIKWLGTSWNFAHWQTYPTMLMFIATTIVPTGVLIYLGVKEFWPLLLSLIVCTYLSLELAWAMAKPPG